jgi:hypothetical protein
MDSMENSRDNSLDNVKRKGQRNKGPSHYHNMNWNHKEVMALISCKHKEHITLKEIVDPEANTILTM